MWVWSRGMLMALLILNNSLRYLRLASPLRRLSLQPKRKCLSRIDARSLMKRRLTWRLCSRWCKKKSRSWKTNWWPFWTSCRSMNRSSRRTWCTTNKTNVRWCKWIKFKRNKGPLQMAQFFQERRLLRRSKSFRTSRWSKWRCWWRIQVWCRWVLVAWPKKLSRPWWWKLFVRNVVLKTSCLKKQELNRSRSFILLSNLNSNKIQNSLGLTKRCKWKPWLLLSRLRVKWVVATEWIINSSKHNEINGNEIRFQYIFIEIDLILFKKWY